jgi:hypothetical protein
MIWRRLIFEKRQKAGMKAGKMVIQVFCKYLKNNQLG